MKQAALSAKAQFGYIPGLDGVRALAVLLVMAAHFGLSRVVPGGFGVTAFFFLSGFLITRLLIAESEASGRIHLKNFYLRRFARLYPALLFMLIGSTLLFAAFKLGGPTRGEMIAAPFYGMNILLVLQSYGLGSTAMSWSPLWSLAVEEHFYLLFPLVLVLAGARWKRAIGAVSVLILLVLLWRIIIVFGTSLPSQTYTYVMTDARIDSILWGCLASLLLHARSSLRTSPWLIGWRPAVLAGAVLLLTFLFRDAAFRQTIRYTAQGAALMVLVFNLYFNPVFGFVITTLEFPLLAWLGRLSYPLYLWHYVAADFWERLLGHSPWIIPLSLVFSLALAVLSFYGIEKPARALRQRFGAHLVS